MEKEICEQATGIRENGSIGKFFDDNGNEITLNEAKKLFRQGRVIEIPNAGAGSYREVLNMLGYKKVRVYEWTSSFGDWTFIVKGPRYVSQENRYPYHGFRYGLCEVYD